MLSELNIKDFAIIEGLSLSFAPGLNIFTGETGAGKSIIMDAISLILGERASNDLIRSSAEEARVEAQFDPSPASVERVLKEAGIEPTDTLLIKRVVQRAGRNRITRNKMAGKMMKKMPIAISVSFGFAVPSQMDEVTMVPTHTVSSTGRIR